MEFADFFREAKLSITIVGTSSLMPELERSGQFLADLLTLNEQLKITILCESDSELFQQSLCTDTPYSQNRISFSSLEVHRDRILGKGTNDGLAFAISRQLSSSQEQGGRLARVAIRQVNVRLPVNIIAVDGRIWFCIVSHIMPTPASYLAAEDEKLRHDLLEFIDFYTNAQKGGIYLSEPGEELIELYDKNNFPRGIVPRRCFYNTAFKRYSIWAFVFNRHGHLLLHQRSQKTKDGRGLWDKSAGGHVDLRDSSTYITAQRELVEELFLPEAEFSRYIRADLGDIVNFGDWNMLKRPEHTFREAFSGLAQQDWVMFRATDEAGNPLVVSRTSERRIHEDDHTVASKRTVFLSDVYLFIAPPGYIDTDEQVNKLLGLAEGSGAAEAHKLVSVAELRDWIAQEERDGRYSEVFTDDLLYINIEYRGLLERFAEFIAYLA
jgi:hypothetical protein